MGRVLLTLLILGGLTLPTPGAFAELRVLTGDEMDAITAAGSARHGQGIRFAVRPPSSPAITGGVMPGLGRFLARGRTGSSPVVRRVARSNGAIAKATAVARGTGSGTVIAEAIAVNVRRR